MSDVNDALRAHSLILQAAELLGVETKEQRLNDDRSSWVGSRKGLDVLRDISERAEGIVLFGGVDCPERPFKGVLEPKPMREVVHIETLSAGLATALAVEGCDGVFKLSHSWEGGEDKAISDHQAAAIEVAATRRLIKREQSKICAIASLKNSSDVELLQAMYAAGHRAFVGRKLNIHEQFGKFESAVDCGWCGFEYDDSRSGCFWARVGQGSLVVKIEEELPGSGSPDAVSVEYQPLKERATCLDQVSLLGSVVKAELEAVERFAAELANEDVEVFPVEVCLV